MQSITCCVAVASQQKVEIQRQSTNRPSRILFHKLVQALKGEVATMADLVTLCWAKYLRSLKDDPVKTKVSKIN